MILFLTGYAVNFIPTPKVIMCRDAHLIVDLDPTRGDHSILFHQKRQDVQDTKQGRDPVMRHQSTHNQEDG